MKRAGRVYLGLVLSLFVLSACGDRAYAPVVAEATALEKQHRLFVATNRSLSDEGFFDAGRARALSFLTTSVSVPPAHERGDFSVSYRKPNPQKHFAISGQTHLDSAQEFVAAINKELTTLPPNKRDIVVFVHGYFNSYANTVYRSAQVVEDMKVEGVTVAFSWPSAGNALAYTYDRESVLYSRDDFETFLRLVAKTNARRVIVVAHSMGSALLMEALRQIELQQPGWSDRNITAAALIAPDIPVDLFRKQAMQIKKLPQPFVIAVSEKDRVLQLSQTVNNNSARLGRDTKAEDVADLPVILINITEVADGAGDGHMAVVESDTILSMIQGVGELESILGSTGGQNGTVIRVKNATEVVIVPQDATPSR